MEIANEANQPKDDPISICKQDRLEEPILNISDSFSSEESSDEGNKSIDADADAAGSGTNSNAVAGMEMANNTSDDETADSSSCSNGDETTKMESPKVSSQVNWSTYWPLCKMIQENDWEGVEDFVEKHPEALTVEITRSNRIFDHIFFFLYDDGEGVARLIEKLATKIDSITLEKRAMFTGFTVLHLCAMIGNRRASEILVQCNPKLPNIRNNHDFLPVHSAAYYGHKYTVQYLIKVTEKDNLQGRSGAHLISALIESNFYDLAFDFLKQNPAMGRDSVHSRNVVLGTLARKPLAFESGSRLGLWQRFIYNCIPVKKEKNFSMAQTQINKNQGVEGDVENLIGRSKNYSTKPFSFGSLRQITRTTFGSIYQELHRMFWNALVFLVPYIKFIHDQKLTHMQAIEIVQMICEGVTWNDPDSVTMRMSLHTAASFGISEIVNEIVMNYNRSVYWIDKEGSNLFHLAILHRREKVFNLIYRTRFLNHMLVRVDQYGNNLLHLAGGLVPSSKVVGAALQMQRELQWFKAVENFMRPADREKQNHAKKTPREVFTETHKELVKEGEKWMKETASSCTIAVTLIITVVFAAAFTVPGGNNANGLPTFLHNEAFLVFAISDVMALFSSTTSLLMFLGILTSRYSEDDFLTSLPRKLIIGLMTLFFSIASMLVAFCATIYIVLFNPWKWAIIPISLLGCVPVTLFALLQFPLLLDMVLSTYGPSIFRPKNVID